MLELGGCPSPTATNDGPYVRLTNLLYNTAIGGSLESDLHKVCMEHLKALKDEGLDLSARYWRMLRSTSPPMPADLLPLAEATKAEFRARRIEAAREWPTLQQIVDEILPRGA